MEHGLRRLSGFTQITSISDYLLNQRHQRSNTNCGKLQADEPSMIKIKTHTRKIISLMKKLMQLLIKRVVLTLPGSHKNISTSLSSS